MTGIARRDVLAALDEFDSQGGGSLGLVAWELLSSPTVLARLWQEMQDDGVISPQEIDPIHGERMFRLTVQGRDELRGVDLGSRRRSL